MAAPAMRRSASEGNGYYMGCVWTGRGNGGLRLVGSGCANDLYSAAFGNDLVVV